jgi:hypothetical protein
MKIYRIKRHANGLFYIASRKWYWPFSYTWCNGYFDKWENAYNCVQAKLHCKFFNDTYE